MAFVLVYNLTPDEFQETQLDKIEKALLLAIVNVIPEMESVSGDIGFSFLQDSSVTNDSTDIPALIVVEGIRNNLGKIDTGENLAKEIHKYFKRAAPKEGRRVEVIIRNPLPSEGYYDGY